VKALSCLVGKFGSIKMNSLVKLILLSLSFCMMGAYGGMALEYRVHPGNKSKTLTAVLATGEIMQGDTVRLGTFLDSLPKRKNRAIYLASPGGNLLEGMALGKFFQERHIKTIVEGGQVCASACALAFLGGTDNDGQPWRSSSTNSLLGFHAFRSSGTENISSDDVQRVVALMIAYGREVHAPIDLLIVGFATPSNKIYYVPNRTICALGIKLWSVETDSFVCN